MVSRLVAAMLARSRYDSFKFTRARAGGQGRNKVPPLDNQLDPGRWAPARLARVLAAHRQAEMNGMQTQCDVALSGGCPWPGCTPPGRGGFRPLSRANAEQDEGEAGCLDHSHSMVPGGLEVTS